MDLVHGVNPTSSQVKDSGPATKIRRPIRWLWFDWAIFVVFAGIVVASGAVRPLAVPWWARLIILAVMGAVLVAAYHLTLHRLWVRLVPGWYRKWLCSRCGQRVTRTATRCIRCGAQFQ